MSEATMRSKAQGGLLLPASLTSVVRLAVTYFTDPGCPWAYSVEPALQVLRWRYGDQLEWRLVVIGLTESGSQYEERGYTPALMAQGYARFRRYEMPFSTEPKRRVAGTGRACRAIVAARLEGGGLEWRVLRALQLAWFTTPLVLDEDQAIATALASIDGLDPAALLARLEDPAVERAYQADHVEARSAAGSPAELQGKTARTDGPERFTAPTLVLERDGLRLVAGGFQPLEAYDVLVANLNPGLERQAPPAEPLPLLRRFPDGLTGTEVAALLARGNDPPDRVAAEHALIELAARGLVTRLPLGDGALWRLNGDG